MLCVESQTRKVLENKKKETKNSASESKKRLVQFPSSDESSDSEHEQPKSQTSRDQTNEYLHTENAAAAVALESDDEQGKEKNKKSEDSSSCSGSSPSKSKIRSIQFPYSDESSDSENEQPESRTSRGQTNELLDAKNVAAAVALESDDEEGSSVSESKRCSIQFPYSDESSDSENEQPESRTSRGQTNELLDAKNVAAAVALESDDEEGKEKNKDSEDSSSCSDSSDDESPPIPIRIFRNKNAAKTQDRGFDNGSDLSEDEGISEERREGRSQSPPLPAHRRSKRTFLPNTVEIRSETQRLIRESRVNLPYHVPAAKKLSQILKRPSAFQNAEQTNKTKNSKKFDDNIPNFTDDLPNLTDNIPKSTDEKRDSGVEVLDSPKRSEDPVKINNQPLPTDSNSKTVISRKEKLLARAGEITPTLKPRGVEPKPRRLNEFVDLDSDNEENQPSEEISNFMQRFFKHSSLEKDTSSKKKVQFNIIRKEDRPDGSGVELVPDVVTTISKPEQDKTGQIDDFKTLRAKLTARMKQRRSEERLKRQELYKLDNEEIGNDEDEEEEEEEENWSDEDESDEEKEDLPSEDEKNKDKLKVNRIVDDDDDDDQLDDESQEPTQPIAFDTSLSNVPIASDTSQHALRSDSMSSHLTREGSMLLFEDTKKSSCSRELSLNECSIPDQTLDPLYSSTIPPNKTESSDLSNSSRVPRLNSDEDSYFCSERSMNASPASSLRPEYESQFFDSDGFIRDTKTNKSLSSLLPPGGEDDNANDGNMSQLLELCSGKFQVSEIDPQISDAETGEEVNGAFIDESFGFQVEAGALDRIKDDGFSDADKSNANKSDADNSDFEEEDEGITIIRKKKDVAGSVVKNFLEEEAELSGDDVDSDDDDNDDGDNKEDHYEIEENDEQLPKEEVIHQQVNKVHLKQLLDDDQRDIDLLQEAFVTENIEVRRNRKFRWKNIDDNLTQDLFHSDEEDDPDPSVDTNDGDEPGDEESQWRMMRLEREEYFNSNSQNVKPEDLGIEEDSQLLRMGKTALRKHRVLSEINEDSSTNPGNKPTSLSRSSSFTSSKSLSSKNSFLTRNPEILSKFANFKEASVIRGAVNSDRMVFKAVSPTKKNVRVRRPAVTKQPKLKRPRLDEDSNSIFNLFEV